MRASYRLHPDKYALGENEKFYSDMEAKGWRLAKRGMFWSKFIPAEPSCARYRVEVRERAPYWDEDGTDEAWLAVFADCGWEYVTGSGMLQVFRAPQGSSAPELYTDPRQQAATLKKLEKQYWLGWCPTVGVFCVNLLLHASRWGGASYRQRGWVEQTSAFLAMAVFLLWLLYRNLYGAWQLRQTCLRMKRGEPLDHNPQHRRLAHKVVSCGMLAVCAAFLLLTAAQQMLTYSTDLPQQAEGPYLLLSDLGWEGERIPSMDQVSTVTANRSLAADYWDVREYMDGASLFQSVYRMHSPAAARNFIRALMDTSSFGERAENFTPVEAAGLDAAWTSRGMDLVAVKGKLVVYLTYISSSGGFDAQEILTALAARWAADGNG